ncbi:MAG TPA: sn-glycerol-1-phosphate dehydrogenase [Casimicrobiaceae bacterium]|nr:sn-glycerol-1-phosphate dehydrogenase [Casimicrobiaceae bacterium]
MSTESVAPDEAVLRRAVSRASVTREVDVGENAIARLPALLGRLGASARIQVVADRNTMRAAGDRAVATLQHAGRPVAPPIVLDETPRVKPRLESALALGERCAGTVPIAVGSGVVNDLVKYAAQRAGVPYVSVVTAASMDGYAASGAALLERGFKRTVECAPPIGVVADLGIVANAPSRMAAWGYGDLSGKLVAGADWTLADALGEDAIAAEPFAVVQDNVAQWLAHVDGIARGERDALRGLVVGLLVSGFAIQAHGNSRPASGSDHQFAHLWEMEGLSVDGEPVAHGACVGVGAVAMLALYEWFVAEDVAARARECCNVNEASSTSIDDELAAAFTETALLDSARVETNAKQARASQRPARMRLLAEGWPRLRERLRARLMPPAALQQRLAACNAPSHPEALGVSLRKLAADYRRARLIRRRYTLLDCLDDLGWLDRAIDAVFAPGGFWGRDRAALQDASA